MQMVSAPPLHAHEHRYSVLQSALANPRSLSLSLFSCCNMKYFFFGTFCFASLFRSATPETSQVGSDEGWTHIKREKKQKLLYSLEKLRSIRGNPVRTTNMQRCALSSTLRGAFFFFFRFVLPKNGVLHTCVQILHVHCFVHAHDLRCADGEALLLHPAQRTKTYTAS